MEQEIETVCPSCSPEEPVWHEVLRTGQNPTVRCQECGDVHPAETRKETVVRVNVVVSKEDESFTRHTNVGRKDMIHVEEEIIVDDEEMDDVYPIIVTSIEAQDKRVEFATADTITTIWGRATDEVVVKIAIRSDSKTTSVNMTVPGDYEFVIGESDMAGRKKFTISRIKIRDGNFASRRGDRVAAKYIKRIYAEAARTTGWGEGRTAWSEKYTTNY
ncbi:MAG: HVO_0476 family zinc finger protein [Methanosarcinaceae archaeon]